VSLRRDQLIPVNKAVNEKEQLEKGLEEEDKKIGLIQLFVPSQMQHETNINVRANSRP
jgi:hypothetical protein